MLIILLMIIFRTPESGRRTQRGSYCISFFFQDTNTFFSDLLLFRCGVKDTGKILRTYIRPLAVCLRKVMYFKKNNFTNSS